MYEGWGFGKALAITTPSVEAKSQICPYEAIQNVEYRNQV